MSRRFVISVALVAAVVSGAARPKAPPRDAVAARWVEKTLASSTLDEKIGQLLVSSFESTYLPDDSEAFIRLSSRVTETHVGGFLVFGGTEAIPPVLLNPSYGTVIRGQPLEAAVTLNRLQRLAKVPLLNAADFEFGVGMRIAGGTEFPRAMAFGATGDPSLAEHAGRIIAEESRAIGVHVDFAPVADVNNNPRNPVIDTRSFGEDRAQLGAMAAAFVRGLKAGGVLATLKHFPGHGDTDIDTHLGLPVLPHDRARLDRVELPPFRLGLAAGAEAGATIARLYAAFYRVPEERVTEAGRLRGEAAEVRDRGATADPAGPRGDGAEYWPEVGRLLRRSYRSLSKAVGPGSVDHAESGPREEA